MKKIAGGIAVAVLLALCWTGVVYGAPKEGKGLIGRIADSLLGEKNTPGVLVPILEDEDATSALAYELSSAIDAKMVDIVFNKRKFGWAPGDIDKDATAIKFSDTGLSRFQLRPDANILKNAFFGMYKKDLGLTDDDQFVETRALDQDVPDSAGTIQYRHSIFTQKYKGVPVLGAQVILHEKDGTLASGNGKIARGIDIDVTPAISMETAASIALSTVNAEIYSWQSAACTGVPNCIPDSNPAAVGWFCMENVTGSCTPIEGNGEYFWYCVGDIGEVSAGEVTEPIPGWCDEPQGELAILSKQAAMTAGSYMLVWTFDIASAKPLESRRVLIDAMTGDVLSDVDSSFFDLEGVDTACQGNTRYNGLQNFTATLAPDGYYYLYQTQDLTLERPISIVRDTSTIDGEAGTYPPPVFPDGDNADGMYRTLADGPCLFDDAEDLLGATVLWGLESAWNFYKQYGWYGTDGIAEQPVNAFMHYHPTKPSMYDFLTNTIYYSGVADDVYNEGVAFVTVAHEYAHAVTFGMVPHLADGALQPETRMLAEGLAALLGLATEASTNGGVFDWCYGEENKVSGQCIVNISDPNAWLFPDTYGGQYWIPVETDALGNATTACTKDNDWCHGNGTIVAYWYYLLINGGDGENDNGQFYHVDPIDPSVAARIVIDAMRYHMDPTPTILDFSYGTIDAAKALYSKKDPVVISIQNAWHAVGVGEAYDYGYFSPGNGAPDVGAWPTRLTWEADSATSQRVLVSMSPDFDKSYILSPSEDMPLLQQGGGIDSQRVLRTAKVNLKTNRTYYWKVVTLDTTPDTTANGGMSLGFSLIPWLKNIVGIADPGDGEEPNLSPDYVLTPAYPGATMTPIRYFKTSKMKTELIRPNAVDRAHPWQARLVTGYVPGATYLHIELTDVETGEFERVVVDTSEVLDNATKTYVVKKDLKVDHHYTWRANVQGPDVHSPLPLLFNMGASSEVKDFWTGVPEVQLITPSAEMEVQPAAFFQWSELEGIGEELDNGASYRLIVSAHADLSDPVVSEDGIQKPEQNWNLPPTNAAGNPAEYYWSILPIGPSEYGETGDLADPIHFKVDASATRPHAKSPSSTVPYNSQIVFYWVPVEGAEGYVVDVYRANDEHVLSLPADLSQLVENGGGTSVEFWPGSGVDWSSVTTDMAGYCWTVRGIFNGNPGLASNKLCYTVSGSRPVLVSPAHGSQALKGYSDALPFIWEADYAPNGYVFELWEGEHCGGDYHLRERTEIPDGNVKSYATLSDKHYAGRFTWRVCSLTPTKAHSSCANCNVFDLRIGHEPEEEEDNTPDDPEQCSQLSAPNILQPASMAVYTVPQITVQWSTVPSATEYYWELRSSGNAFSPVPWDDEGEGVTIASGNTTSTSTILQMYNILVATGVPIPSVWMDNDFYFISVSAVNECGEVGPESWTFFVLMAN